MTTSTSLMPEPDRGLHRALMEGLLGTGATPSPNDLVAAFGIKAAELTRRLAALQAADYLSLDPAGGVSCLYPFSPAPTPHVVVIGDQRRYAMCAIDALGMAAMLGQPVQVEGVCGACDGVIRLMVAPQTIERATPTETVVLVRRSGDEPACETCCPSTLFACGPAHGAELAERITETVVVPLEEALHHAESIFGDLLGDVLPARRRRSEISRPRLRT
ncbi:MAG: alkylmercury lyase family protein [Thermomicrobiales bacterium]